MSLNPNLMVKRVPSIVFALFISATVITACGSKPAAEQPEASQPADSAQQEHPAEHPAEHPQDSTTQN